MTRRQIFLSLFFVVFLTLLLIVINEFFLTGVRHAENSQLGKVSLLMRHQIDPQVIIFGASNGETGIAPQVLSKYLGDSVFNMCLDGTSVLQFSDLVNEFNDYSVNAKTVVFALGPTALSKVELPTSMNRYYGWIGNKYINKNHFLNSIPDFKKAKYVPFYGFVLYDSFFYKHAFEGWSRIFNYSLFESANDTKGWSKMNVKWGENNSVRSLDTLIISIDPIMLDAYKELVTVLNRKGRNVVFVLMPSQQDAFVRYKGYEELRKSIEQISRSPNRLIDMSNDDIIRDKKWFYNYTHLNAEGAYLFSEKLVFKMTH